MRKTTAVKPHLIVSPHIEVSKADGGIPVRHHIPQWSEFGKPYVEVRESVFGFNEDSPDYEIEEAKALACAFHYIFNELASTGNRYRMKIEFKNKYSED